MNHMFPQSTALLLILYEVRNILHFCCIQMYAVQLPADKLEIDHGNNSRKWNWFVDGNDRSVHRLVGMSYVSSQ